jgi:hypothetical protein
MMLMPANHSSPTVHYLAGKYPNRLAWLVGPSAMSKTKLRPWMPYALDNDAFSAWSQKKPWDVEAWRALLQWAQLSRHKPLWVLVPDVVADREATLQNWVRYAPEAAAYKWPLAFAVQDGMTPADVPADAAIVFVGGTTRWKWQTLPMWAESCARVHVGRVNELRRLWTCEEYGVESVDGTGWFRDTQDGRRIRHLKHWLEQEKATQEVLL